MKGVIVTTDVDIDTLNLEKLYWEYSDRDPTYLSNIRSVINVSIERPIVYRSIYICHPQIHKSWYLRNNKHENPYDYMQRQIMKDPMYVPKQLYENMVALQNEHNEAKPIFDISPDNPLIFEIYGIKHLEYIKYLRDRMTIYHTHLFNTYTEDDYPLRLINDRLISDRLAGGVSSIARGVVTSSDSLYSNADFTLPFTSLKSME